MRIKQIRKKLQSAYQSYRDQSINDRLAVRLSWTQVASKTSEQILSRVRHYIGALRPHTTQALNYAEQLLQLRSIPQLVDTHQAYSRPVLQDFKYLFLMHVAGHQRNELSQVEIRLRCPVANFRKRGINKLPFSTAFTKTHIWLQQWCMIKMGDRNFIQLLWQGTRMLRYPLGAILTWNQKQNSSKCN